jgi:RNA polymerase sigma factor (sigma-70 family)
MTQATRRRFRTCRGWPLGTGRWRAGAWRPCYHACLPDWPSSLPKANPQFVTRLFQEQSEPLLKYLVTRFRDREDAAEIAQETWLKMYGLEHPEHLSNPRAYLFQMASNLGVDRVRHSAIEHRFNRQEQASARTEAEPSAETSVAAQESLALVSQALSELPEPCRQAFILHRGRDLSYPEIANELGVSTSMVEKHIIRALRHLRDKLSD